MDRWQNAGAYNPLFIRPEAAIAPLKIKPSPNNQSAYDDFGIIVNNCITVKFNKTNE